MSEFSNKAAKGRHDLVRVTETRDEKIRILAANSEIDSEAEGDEISHEREQILSRLSAQYWWPEGQRWPAPVFVINLDRSPDRLAFMQAQGERLNFNFERVRGVNGTRGLPKWLAPQFVSETDEILSKMSSGEVGCYASHLIALSRMVDRKIGAAIILEDDVTLDDDFFTTAEAAMSAAPEGWDLIHLSTHFKRPCFAIAELNGDRRLVRHSRLPAGSVAYAISMSGVSKLLASKVRKRPYDMEFRYGWLADLDIYGVHPAPAVHEGVLAPTIEAPWRTKLKSNGRYWQRKRRLPKARWAPNLLSQIWGVLFIKRKLGLVGTLACWKKDAGGLQRLAFRRPRSQSQP